MTIKKHLAEVKKIILLDLADQPVKIFLFGSQASKLANYTSDIDIGVIPYGKFNANLISNIQNKLRNSNIPLKVDLVDFRYVSDDFRSLALQNIVEWKN